MRAALAVAFLTLAGLAAVATQQRFPLRQDLEILKEALMRFGGFAAYYDELAATR